MTEAVEAIYEATHPQPGLARVLLDGKIRIPSLPQASVSRRAIIQRARRSEARVVGVTAPAGYGKSTLLAEWADSEERPLAWASLDRLDNDPAALLSIIAHAGSTISAAVAAVASQMGGVGAGPLGRAAPLLATALANTESPFVLLIDDLQDADSLDCQDALEIVLAGIPEASQVVIASRHEQPHLARLRAGGSAFEIEATDLCLDAQGARAVFDRAGVEVSDEDLLTVVDRCEGWPTGILLCALVFQSGGEASELAGNDKYLSEYLYRECVRSLPADTQRFLRRSAVLERFTPSACDAVMRETNSRAHLRKLEAQGLFVIALDRQREWFRYHALFRDYLLAELRHHESALEPDLHHRAAAWHESAGYSEQAVEHLIAAGDQRRAAQLAAELAIPTYQAGRVQTVRRWIHSIGQETIETYVPMLVVAAWVSVLLGEIAEAQRCVDILERTSTNDMPEDARLQLESARAMLRAALCVDGATHALADATFAVANEPAWSPWRDQALHLFGSTSLLAGSVEDAQHAFTEAVIVGKELGNVDSILLAEAELAHMAIDAGKWTRALRHSQAAVDAIDASHMEGYSTAALAFAVRARVAFHFNDPAAGERYLARAMRARVQCTMLLPYMSVRVRLQLAMAYASTNNRTAAMHLLHEADQVIRMRPALGRLIDQVASCRRRVEGSVGVAGSPPLTPAELRLLPYLQTHLTTAEIGVRLFVSRNTVSSEISSIYRKLGVSTRSKAVARACEIGLLGE